MRRGGVAGGDLSGSYPNPRLISSIRTGLVTNCQSTTLTSTTQTTVTTAGTFYDISGISVTITPSSTASTVFVFGSVDITSATTDALVILRLMRDSTAIGQPTSPGSRSAGNSGIYLQGVMANSNSHYPIPYQFLDSPATTSAVTYKLQGSSNVNSTVLSVNRSSADTDAISQFRATSNISVWEVLA